MDYAFTFPVLAGTSTKSKSLTSSYLKYQALSILSRETRSSGRAVHAISTRAVIFCGFTLRLQARQAWTDGDVGLACVPGGDWR